MQPVTEPITARRNVPFAAEWSFDDEAVPVDFTGATVEMEVRLFGAQPGNALISLAEVGTEQTEGLFIGTGTIAPFIDALTLALLPAAPLAGGNAVFAYDLRVDLADRPSEIWRQGQFIVKPGVTDPFGVIRITESGAIRTTESGAIRVLE